MKKYTRRNANYKILVIVLTILLTVSGIAYSPRHASSDENNTGNISQTIDSALNSQIAKLFQQKQSLTPTQQKIDWNLLQKLQQINEQYAALPTGKNLSLQNFSTSMFKINNEGVIEVKLTVSNVTDEQINQLKALGMDIQITLPEYGIIEGKLPYDKVETIANLDFVEHISTPSYPIYNTGAVTSAGDSVLKADLARSTFGINGSGSKIGVMSDGVDHLANSVASGDLPSDVQVLQAGSGDEGTAMLEIIHDLAPGADLAFYSPSTSSDMVVGIGALESAGCNIIVDDLTFFDEPKFEDGPIAQRAREFVNDGGVYVTSAGNFRHDHYIHQYVRTNVSATGYTYAHNYGSGDIGNDFTIPNGGYIYVILQWNNQWGVSGDDFDLFLAQSSDGSVLADSIDAQDGNNNPWEGLYWYNNTGASVMVFVAVLEYSLVSNPSSLVLNYYLYPANFPLQYDTTSDSVIGHAAVDEVLSTAAVAAATPNTLETYSSSGPGTIYFPSYQQRQVPDITGTDGVQTKTGQLGYFSNPFYGTSAAAPHIAAIAALVWDANPTLNSSQVRNVITSTAVDLSTTGFDYNSGWGRANASAAVNSVLFTLNTSSSNGGTVTTPGVGSFRQYTYEQVVNIVATNDSCDYFVNWSGDTATIANTSASSTTITMNDSYSITANFASTGVTYNLTVSSGGYGSATPSGTTSQTCNASVPIDATANASYSFVNWTGDNASIANPNAASTTIFMNGSKTIQANFILTPWDVNGDDRVNAGDMVLIGQHWGQTGTPGWIPEDVNQNGVINAGDMVIIGQHWAP